MENDCMCRAATVSVERVRATIAERGTSQHAGRTQASGWSYVLTVCAAVAGLAAGCSRGTTLDLTEQFDTAVVQREASRIDFGTPAARDHLAAGWGIDETSGGTSIVWALGQRSSVDFFVGAPRPITLRARCWPLLVDGLPTQTARVILNGVPLEELSLSPQQAEYSVPVPAAALRAGLNRLDFAYAYTRRPIDLAAAARDPRPLAVAWDWLVFDGLGDSAAPARRNGGGGGLVLPTGSAISYHLDVAPGATLALDDVMPLLDEGGSAGAVLEVRLRRVGEDAPHVIELAVPGPTGPQRWTLDGGISRITFRSVPRRGGGAGGLLLRGPRLHSGPTGMEEASRCADDVVEPRARAPVLIYLIDTLRADHMGCYGYQRPTTPRIDAFARDAVRFEHAVAQSSWTKSSVASIFTGLRPRRHGANRWGDVMADVPTLARLLSAADYEAVAFVTNSAVAPRFGFDEGFAAYHLLAEQQISPEFDGVVHPFQLVQQGADVLRLAALDWLDARTSARPFFLYLHASDPHDPYLPPEAFRQQLAPAADPTLGLSLTVQDIMAGRRAASDRDRADMIDLYDADIAFADHEFGALMDGLRERGLYEDMLIVLVSDHGEAFGGHGTWQHGTSLYPEQIHVPLLIKFPGRRHAGSVVSALAQHVDILPTILDALGLQPPDGLTGTSLLPALTCPDAAGRRPPAYLFVNVAAPALESIILGERQLIHHVRAVGPHATRELYDLAVDPTAARDIAPQRPVEVGYLSSLMIPFLPGPATAIPALARTPDAAVLERLRALGYAP
jgi:arylsulfatase A-like enzyme